MKRQSKISCCVVKLYVLSVCLTVSSVCHSCSPVAIIAITRTSCSFLLRILTHNTVRAHFHPIFLTRAPGWAIMADGMSLGAEMVIFKSPNQLQLATRREVTLLL